MSLLTHPTKKADAERYAYAKRMADKAADYADACRSYARKPTAFNLDELEFTELAFLDALRWVVDGDVNEALECARDACRVDEEGYPINDDGEAYEPRIYFPLGRECAA